MGLPMDDKSFARSLEPLNPFVMYAGLSDFVLPTSRIDLSEGIYLRQAYSRFSNSFILVNTAPEKYPKEIDPKYPQLGPLPPPAFWNLGERPIEIRTELVIEQNVRPAFDRRVAIARLVVITLRFCVDPAVAMPVVSTHPFNSLIEQGLKGAALVPLAAYERRSPLDKYHNSSEEVEAALKWLGKHWGTVLHLYTSSTEFRLAVDAIEIAQYVQNSALGLVSMWGAIEAVFSPSNAELKFRVSAYLAAYLEPPGIARLERQRAIAALYDKRSAAAHGKPKHEHEHFHQTFDLLRRALMKMIENGAVPTKEQLEDKLFVVE